MSFQEDDRLRAHFAKLREQDHGAAPPFVGTASRSGDARRRSSIKMALAFAAVAIIALAITVRARRATDATSQDLAAWSSPTDFLLETPGRQFLNQTPRLGAPLIEPVPAAQ